jgi:hypothetical protein
MLDGGSIPSRDGASRTACNGAKSLFELLHDGAKADRWSALRSVILDLF